MDDVYDALVRRIIESNSSLYGCSLGDLFSSFVRETAPTIEFLENKGLSCDFFASQEFMKGWSVGFMPDSISRSDLFIVRKWHDAASNQIEIEEGGIVQREVTTPTQVFSYVRNKFGAPSP